MCTKFKFLFCLIFLFILLSVSGCSGTAPKPIPAGTNIQSIKLKDDYEFRAEYFTGVIYGYSIKSGEYKAVGTDSKGVYYLGSKNCLTTKVIEPSWGLEKSLKGKEIAIADCGIYLPLKQSSLPKVFTIIGSRESLSGNTDVANKSEKVSASSFSGNTQSLQGGAGVGIGVGIANAIIAAEQGRFLFVRNQIITKEFSEYINKISK